MKSAGLVAGGTGSPIEPRYVAISDAGPTYARRPPERISVLSKPSKTFAEGWWIVQRTAAFRSIATFCIIFMIAAAPAASRPDVGSSKMTSEGDLASASPSDSRRFWPPESPLISALPARVFAHDSNPSSFKSLLTCNGTMRCGSIACAMGAG